MKEKITKLIIPYFLISIGLIVLFSFNNQNLLSDIGIYFIPVILTSLFVLFYLRKKLNLLVISSKHKEFLIVITIILVSAPIYTYNHYIERHNGKLTELKSVNDIWSHNPTMFYSIENAKPLKNKTGIFTNERPANRGNEIVVDCYFACPLYDSLNNFNDNNIWIAKHFNEFFSDRVLDDKAKQANLIASYKLSTIEEYHRYIYQTNFLRRIENDTYYYNSVLQTNRPFDEKNLIILVEEVGSYETRTGTSLWWTKFLLIISNAFWIFNIIFLKSKENNLQHNV